MKIYLYSLLVILSLPKLSSGQTATRDNAGLQGNAGAVSGFFETVNPANYPAGATSWWHLLDVRHSNNTNNYAMQFSGSFFDQNLYFRKTNNNPAQAWSRVILETNGKVGIGTTAPTEMLSVKGKIRAQEVKVETANWPDYVFTKAYKLPTLAETESHIRAKGHLPGIPSAAEVTEKGIELGEMNKKLLEKIEELTLHLIEMKKENEDQKTSINSLINRIQSLENKQKNNLN